MAPSAPSGYPATHAPADEVDAFVRYGTVDQRWHATICENLSLWAMEQLASDPDEHVRAALVDNWRVPTELLERMWVTNPELRERIARHYNASPAMKGPIPLWQHSSRAVEIYAQDRGAPLALTERLLELHANADRDRRTLAEAFEEAGGDGPL